LLRQNFRPEFLNRLDETVFYKPLSKAEIGRVVELMLHALEERLAEKQLRLRVEEEAKAWIVEEGYDPVYGARPLRRFIQSRVETLVARSIIAGDPLPGDTLCIGLENGVPVLRCERPAPAEA
jgi:ATP-dependent Clp protease ATP-binding subunit ClpB